MTYGAAIERAQQAPDGRRARPTIDVTIPEGLSRARDREARRARRTCSGSYLAASKRFSGRLNPFRYGAPKGTRSTEGFLFPATYELKAAAPAKDLVDRQLKAFEDNFASVDLRRAKRKNLTAYDVLIIASMVEREAQLASERKLVAAVIYNRLKDGIPLGIDATSRYELNNWTRPLKRSELESDSPYNTRKRTGLPPTPIGNPGLASIRAAAAPASVSYRYYVVKPGHVRQARVLVELRRSSRPTASATTPRATRPAASRRPRADGDALRRPRLAGRPQPLAGDDAGAPASSATSACRSRPSAFDDTVRALGASGFAGANVTIPHKEAALALATTASDAARAIGAANTLSFGEDGEIAADNTDAPGLMARARAARRARRACSARAAARAPSCGR